MEKNYECPAVIENLCGVRFIGSRNRDRPSNDMFFENG